MYSGRGVLFCCAAVLLTSCASVPGVPQVPAFRETAAVASGDDAADDPAIWTDRAQPAQSRVIATDKKGGLYVFDLSGKAVQFVPAGLVNNVDLRDGFPFAEGAAPIVIASDRDDQSLAVFRFDTAARQLDPVQKAAVPTGFDEVYGICLYKTPSGAFHAVATSKGGRVKQWRLAATGSGIAATQVREFDLGSITEGCVADDTNGILYLAQEDVALWRVPADPAAGSVPVAVDRVGPHLADDIEGVALYARPDGSGYLVVSSQGNSTYAVYERGGSNAYVGSFAIGKGDRADAVTGTDGIDVSAADFGPDFPGGLFVAQDDENSDPAETQNFKLVPFAPIEAAIVKARTAAAK
jgi:3-phytase